MSVDPLKQLQRALKGGRRPRLYLLKERTVDERLDRAHKTHATFAEELGLSRSYWSQILNRKRHLTPKIRAALLAHPVLEGVAEDDLWTIFDPNEDTTP